jgi:TonB family protein
MPIALSSLLILLVLALPAQNENRATAPLPSANSQTAKQSDDTGCLDPNVRAPRTISFGVLNSRGINIPKPPYPALAKSAGLSGQVMAVVVIDETGQVIWARVISGHPLLQAAVKTVVCQARLRPIRVAGHFVKAKGVLTYKFVL